MKSELSNRTLYYDGDSVVNEKFILETLLSGKDIKNLYVKEITKEIQKYNTFVNNEEKLTIKQGIKNNFDKSWNLPENYKNINIEDYVIDKLYEEFNKNPLLINNLQEQTIRAQRITEELIKFQKNNLLSLLKTMIFIINTLQEQKIVWGVGRGSSVSSYILYLIGVHDVDSVKYNLDFSEFIGD